MSEKKQMKVSDYGAAAYLMMYGYRVVGGDGKDILFEIDASDENLFEETKLDYLRSDFHRFDSFLMSIKKIMSKRNYS